MQAIDPLNPKLNEEKKNQSLNQSLPLCQIQVVEFHNNLTQTGHVLRQKSSAPPMLYPAGNTVHTLEGNIGKVNPFPHLSHSFSCQGSETAHYIALSLHMSCGKHGANMAVAMPHECSAVNGSIPLANVQHT